MKIRSRTNATRLRSHQGGGNAWQLANTELWENEFDEAFGVWPVCFLTIETLSSEIVGVSRHHWLTCVLFNHIVGF